MTKCKWTEMVTKLKEDRLAAVAFPISNELTETICSKLGSNIKDTVGAVGNSNGKPTTTFGTKVLITSGGVLNSREITNILTTEIIDIGNSSFECSKVRKFPKPLWWANGGWVGGKPMVCGGSDDYLGLTFQKSCHTLEGNGTWKEDKKATLSRGKQNQISGSVVIKNQLYIPEYVGIGKKDKYGMYTKAYLNFEMAAPNTASKTLQSLNSWGIFEDIYSNQHSCIVKWDANTIMLIGANSQKRETYFINMEYKTVTPGPKLRQGRMHHACNELTLNGETFIVVTGGGSSSGYLKSTEMLAKSIHSYWYGKGWRRGQKLHIT